MVLLRSAAVVEDGDEGAVAAADSSVGAVLDGPVGGAPWGEGGEARSSSSGDVLLQEKEKSSINGAQKKRSGLCTL